MSRQTWNRECRECKKPFEAINYNQTYCCDQHRNDFNNRLMLSALRLIKRPIMEEAITYANAQGISIEYLIERALKNTMGIPPDVAEQNAKPQMPLSDAEIWGGQT